MSEDQIEFDWDRHNVAHLRRHKVSPEEFEEAMNNPRVSVGVEDVDGEERWMVLGMTNSLRVLFMVFTNRDEKIRAVTAMDADRKSQRQYFENVGELNG